MTIKNRNQVIDGWRGLSVLFVIISHLTSFRFGESLAPGPIKEVLRDPAALLENLATRVSMPLGHIGVSVFFVISGYLITSLLDAELRKNDRISIKAFYARRIFRIMPAFYMFIACVFLLKYNGWINSEPSSFALSSLYLCNFAEFECSWWLAHTWSLAVEEQFYLVWPLLFAVSGRFRNKLIYLAWPALMVGSIYVHVLSGFAFIATGALVALSPTIRNAIAAYARTPIILICAALVVFKPLAFPVPALTDLITAVTPMLIAVIIFGTLLGERGGPVRWTVSQPWLAKVGLVSYSLYLWQQISLAPPNWGGQITGAASLYAQFPAIWTVAVIPAALASYFILEKPLISKGRQISDAIMARSGKRSDPS